MLAKVIRNLKFIVKVKEHVKVDLTSSKSKKEKQVTKPKSIN